VPCPLRRFDRHRTVRCSDRKNVDGVQPQEVSASPWSPHIHRVREGLIAGVPVMPISGSMSSEPHLSTAPSSRRCAPWDVLSRLICQMGFAFAPPFDPRRSINRVVRVATRDIMHTHHPWQPAHTAAVHTRIHPRQREQLAELLSFTLAGVSAVSLCCPACVRS